MKKKKKNETRTLRRISLIVATIPLVTVIVILSIVNDYFSIILLRHEYREITSRDEGVSIYRSV